MNPREGSLLGRVLAAGEQADVPTEPAPRVPDAGAVVQLLRAATSLPSDSDARIVAVWDEAGRLHDPEAIDAVLEKVTSARWVPVLGGLRARSLRASARTALAATQHVGTAQLACAVLGAVGTADDVEAIEIIARHPAFTLHAATALSAMAHWHGRAALLRLLRATHAAERVIVIDRLLPHVAEPAVRLALVRDAFTGLPLEHAREVAPYVATACMVKDCLDDPAAPEDVRAGARLVLAACPAEHDA